jgi:hypothetical protein
VREEATMAEVPEGVYKLALSRSGDGRWAATFHASAQEGCTAVDVNQDLAVQQCLAMVPELLRGRARRKHQEMLDQVRAYLVQHPDAAQVIREVADERC